MVAGTAPTATCCRFRNGILGDHRRDSVSRTSQGVSCGLQVPAALPPPTPTPRGREFALLMGGISLVLLALAIRQCIGLANDDAFITYRYARNLASRLGFVFNSGERVLGTTTPLYNLLLTPVGLADGWLPFASNTLGCIGVALQAWAIGRILGRLGSGRFIGAAASLFVLGGGIGSYWHVGLETNLLAALVLWSIERFLAERFGVAGVLAGLAALCRSDATLLSALLLFEMVVHRKKGWRDLLTAGRGEQGHRHCAPPLRCRTLAPDHDPRHRRTT